MEAMREQDALSKHALVSSSKLDFRDGESMAEMQRTVHVGVGKVSEPLWVFLLDLFWGETTELVLRGSGGLEETLLPPPSLVFLFQGLQVVSFSCLHANECLTRRNGVRDMPVRVLWY